MKVSDDIDDAGAIGKLIRICSCITQSFAKVSHGADIGDDDGNPNGFGKSSKADWRGV